MLILPHLNPLENPKKIVFINMKSFCHKSLNPYMTIMFHVLARNPYSLYTLSNSLSLSFYFYLTPISLYYFIFKLYFYILFQKYLKVLSLVFKHAAKKHWEYHCFHRNWLYLLSIDMWMTKKKQRNDTMGEL